LLGGQGRGLRRLIQPWARPRVNDTVIAKKRRTSAEQLKNAVLNLHIPEGDITLPMVYELRMPTTLRNRGWKVKIRNLERTEDPHVTILWKTKAWRYNIRNPGFMDREPDPSDVPLGVVKHIRENLDGLRKQWDKKHPENPVESGGL